MIIKNIALTKMVVYQNISNTLSHTPSPANMSVRFVEKKKKERNDCDKDTNTKTWLHTLSAYL